MARHGLFVLKVPLNLTNRSQSWLITCEAMLHIW